MLSSVLVRSRSVLSSVLVRSCSKLNNPMALFSSVSESDQREKEFEGYVEKVRDTVYWRFDEEDAKLNYGQPCGNPEPFIFSKEDIADDSLWDMYERWLRHMNYIRCSRIRRHQFYSFKRNVISTYERHKADPSVPLVAGLFEHLPPMRGIQLVTRRRGRTRRSPSTDLRKEPWMVQPVEICEKSHGYMVC